MLRWHRVTNPLEWERCQITGDYIRPGEYYLKDDTDGAIISAQAYVAAKEQKREAEWDYSRLEQAQNEREYEEALREADREMLEKTFLSRPIEKGVWGPNG